MAVSALVIVVPSNGTAVPLISNEPANESQISIRNTGTVTVLLGGVGTCVFPLMAGEFLGLQVASDDFLLAEVQTTGTAGQITVLLAN